MAETWHWGQQGRVVVKLDDEGMLAFGLSDEGGLAFYNEAEAIKGVRALEEGRVAAQRVKELEEALADIGRRSEYAMEGEQHLASYIRELLALLPPKAEEVQGA